MQITPSPEDVELAAIKTMHDKHALHITAHEYRFGKLGELMTKQQKAALKKALRELKQATS